MNYNDFIVFDFETGGLIPGHHEAISIAGKAYACRTLQPYPVEQGGEFNSLMKPLHPELLEPSALAVNKISKKELEDAPDQKVVWNNFISWVGNFNPKGTARGAPIGCGKNIVNFDLKFVEHLNLLHAPKKEKTVLFGRLPVDLEHIIFHWFENQQDPAKYNMDALREYFGLSKTGAHSALVDVRQTGALLMKFFQLTREIQRREIIKFKGALAGVA